MNRLLILPLIAFLAISYCVSGQNVFNIAYDNYYYHEGGRGIVQTQDGGYVSYGGTSNFSSQDSLLFLKLNPAGVVEWKFTLDVQPGTGGDFPRNIIELADGSLMACGFAPNAAATHVHPFLIKITAQGQLIWLRRYGNASVNQIAEQVKQTADGGFALGGLNGSNAWLIKTDSLGFMQWDEQYSLLSYINIYALDLTHDGGFILGGSAIVSGLSRQMLPIKTDSLGNQQWYQHYGGAGDDYGLGVVATLDGGYLICGDFDDTYGYAVKTDSNGIEEWNYQSNTVDSDILRRPLQLPDGSYVITGGASLAANERDGSLTKLTPQGGLVWEHTYRYHQTYEHSYLYGITLCTDGGFAIAGMIMDIYPPPQKTDMWILKTDACGNTIGDTLNPHAALSMSNGAGVNSNAYSFTNQSTGHCWQIWYFGDGDSTLAVNPQHTYQQPGNYTVTLVAFAGAYSDTVTQQITIHPCGAVPGDTLLPTAAMLVSPGTQNGTYSLQSQSTEYCSLLWHFGDGNTSTDTNPQYQYQQSGTYTISHIAIKGANADTVTQDVTVFYDCNMAPADTLQPVAAIFIFPGTQNGAYSFTSQSTEYCSLLWYFGDGDTSTVANPQHIYQQSGTYNVVHIAFAGAEADTVTEQISVLVGMQEEPKTVPLQLYPNPNSGDFTIAFEPQPQQGQLQVYDVLGQVVHTEAIGPWRTEKRLSQPGLAQGLYHCRISWGEKTGVVRFVKQ